MVRGTRTKAGAPSSKICIFNSWFFEMFFGRKVSYPFGLVMKGISSKTLGFGGAENKKKYNGIEKESDLSIEIYDAQLRELDGQIGRWWEVDPKTENLEIWSPYVSNNDNPIIYSDPLGDEADGCCSWGDIWNGIQEGVK